MTTTALLLQQARSRISASTLVTAGTFKDEGQLLDTAKKMFRAFQQQLTGFPDSGAAKKAADALKKADNRMQSAKNMKVREDAFLLASTTLKSLLNASKNSPAGKYTKELKDLLKTVKSYDNAWDDDEDLCLFMGIDLADMLLVGSLLREGDVAKAKRHASSMDTAAQDEFPDSMYPLLGWEINPNYIGNF